MEGDTILKISERKIHESFSASKFIVNCVGSSFRFGRSYNCREKFECIREDIPAKLSNVSCIPTQIEYLAAEVNLGQRSNGCWHVPIVQWKAIVLAILGKPLCDIKPSPSNPGRREKIKLDVYFYTSLWCLIGFMKAFKAFVKLFEAPQRSVKIKI